MTATGFGVYDMLVRNASLYPERPAIVSGDTRYSFGDLLTRVDSLAAGLAGKGIAKGDRICILAQNNPGYVELYGACARLGAIAYPINWRLTGEEIGRVLERAQPAMMVVDEFSLELIADWPATRKEIPHWIQMGGKLGEGLSDFGALHAADGAPPLVEIDGEDPFCVISTAAVDIVPRGAVLTHGNLMVSNLTAQAMMEINENDVNIVALPLFHIAALGMAFAVMHAGGCNVIMTRFDPAEAVRLIDEHRGTHISDFPPVLATLLDAAAEAGSKLETLRMVSGLDSPETIARLHESTGARFWTGFGQSETTGFVTLQPFDERPGAAGRPVPLARVKLVDDDDREVPVETPGEILVRGPLVFAGYYGQPEVNEVNFRGGWHHTGDVGRFDKDGYLHYVRRKPEKDLIKSGGENVYPAEVEAAILEMEGIDAACVFGVPDPEWGEAIRAVVQVPSGHGLDAQQVIDFVGGKIARFKRPKSVFFSEALPRTENGEVDRAAVKEQWG